MCARYAVCGERGFIINFNRNEKKKEVRNKKNEHQIEIDLAIEISNIPRNNKTW